VKTTGQLSEKVIFETIERQSETMPNEDSHAVVYENTPAAAVVYDRTPVIASVGLATSEPTANGLESPLNHIPERQLSTGSSENSLDLTFEFSNEYFSVPAQASPLLSFENISSLNKNGSSPFGVADRKNPWAPTTFQPSSWVFQESSLNASHKIPLLETMSSRIGASSVPNSTMRTPSLPIGATITRPGDGSPASSHTSLSTEATTQTNNFLGKTVSTQTDSADAYDLFAMALRTKPHVFNRLLQEAEIRQVLHDLWNGGR
jgi:hypothetical protein